MSITVAEFLRLLPLAAPAGLVSSDETGALIVAGTQRIQITLTQQSDKFFAALKLPQLEVRLDFHQHSSAETSAFIAHFERIYQRGGG
ncbi:MAG: hypothetical protein ACKVN9_02630 [Methylophilaceae bacterium]